MKVWERRKKKRKRGGGGGGGGLTPDGECDVPLKVSVGERGDVAGVAAFVRLLGAGDEQSRVLCGAPALEPHPA